MHAFHACSCEYRTQLAPATVKFVAIGGAGIDPPHERCNDQQAKQKDDEGQLPPIRTVQPEQIQEQALSSRIIAQYPLVPCIVCGFPAVACGLQPVEIRADYERKVNLARERRTDAIINATGAALGRGSTRTQPCPFSHTSAHA